MATRKSTRKTTRKTTRKSGPKEARKAAKTTGRRSAAKAARNGGSRTRADAQPALPMRNVTGQLVLGDCAKAMDWYAKTFGAKELTRMPGPGGKVMHAMMQIGDTAFMLSDSFGQPPAELHGAFLHIHHKDIQKMWDRAIANGATVFMPLADQFWGDKYGQLRDPFGQLWSLGWPVKLTQAEKDRLQQQAMQQMSAPTS